MEEKERQRLQAVFDRLRQWIQDMETLRNVEGIETPEMEDSLRRGRKKLEKLGKRLGLLDRIGLPWFQFYELIENSMYEFLPEKYQTYHVRIETVMANGRQEDVLYLWKEGLNIARKLKIMENEKHPHDDLKNDEITKKREK